ncbi:MAG: dihydroorotase [Candidatus Baltobacteraceae bacterium]
MKALLIKGGRLVDPAASLDARLDLRIRDGTIAEIGAELAPETGEELLDATGAVVAPGFIDMHVHLREPGFPEKETIESGTEAAVRGGFTAVACMPNTNPPLDDPPVLLELANEVRRRGACRVYPIGAITRGRAGSQPCDYAALARAGAVAFSDDGDSVDDASVLREAALRAREVAHPFVSHCEDARLKRAAPGAGIAEDVIAARDLLIASETGKSWHIAHLSTRCSLELVRYARARGASVTCEVTPHHLSCSATSASELEPAAKVNPPLRSEDDLRALRDGVRDGTIDAFASDHAPHTSEEKSGQIGDAAPGFTGLEIAVGAYAAAMPDLPVARFVELLSRNPARILGVPGGSLALGGPGDVTLFADRSWRVDPAAFASKGKSTPFAGHTFPRKVLATVVGGAVRYRAPELARRP